MQCVILFDTVSAHLKAGGGIGARGDVRLRLSASQTAAMAEARKRTVSVGGASAFEMFLCVFSALCARTCHLRSIRNFTHYINNNNNNDNDNITITHDQFATLYTLVVGSDTAARKSVRR
jgi:hypothetical protein